MKKQYSDTLSRHFETITDIENVQSKRLGFFVIRYYLIVSKLHPQTLPFSKYKNYIFT